MKLIDIKWSEINIPKDRYNILSDGKKMAIYKRYLKIFYIRVSGVYDQLDLQEVIEEYNNLNNK
jgi:hypothetical protein